MTLLILDSTDHKTLGTLPQYIAQYCLCLNFQGRMFQTRDHPSVPPLANYHHCFIVATYTFSIIPAVPLLAEPRKLLTLINCGHRSGHHTCLIMYLPIKLHGALPWPPQKAKIACAFYGLCFLQKALWFLGISKKQSAFYRKRKFPESVEHPYM